MNATASNSPPTVPLSDLLADAATELRGQHLHALAAAVDLAAMKCAGEVVVPEPEESIVQLRVVR